MSQEQLPPAEVTQEPLVPTAEQALHDPQLLHAALIQPGLVVEFTQQQAEQQGIDFDQDAVLPEVHVLHTEATTRIAVPETLAKMARNTKRDIAETANTGLMMTDHLLGEALEGSIESQSRRIINQLEEEIHSARYAMQSLRDFEQGYNADPEQAEYAAHRLRSLYDTYGDGRRYLASAFGDRSDAVRQAIARLDHTADEVETARKHFVHGKSELESNPDGAYYDDIESDVLNRAAPSVDEHVASCEKEYADLPIAGADIRDDLTELSYSLLPVAHSSVALDAVEGLPRPDMVVDVVEAIRTTLYRVNNGQPEYRRMLGTQLDELDMTVRRIEQGISSVQDAKAADDQKLTAARETIVRIRGSELLQAA